MASLNQLSQSLKDMIVSEMTDKKSDAAVNTNKYNNLILSMNPDVNLTPHVTVSYSISSATFSLKDMRRLDGGLGHEGRYVLKWLSRSMVREALLENWKEKTKRFSNIEKWIK